MEKIFMKEKSMKKIIIALTLIASLLPAQVVGMNKFQLKKVNRTSCAQSPIIGNSNPFLPEITTKNFFVTTIIASVGLVGGVNVYKYCKYKAKNKKNEAKYDSKYYKKYKKNQAKLYSESRPIEFTIRSSHYNKEGSDAEKISFFFYH